MKRAIVLGGGGSKGAYQVGAWRALREIGIEYDIITGTSIGAINGAMMVQDEYERTLNLWHEIDIDKIAINALNLRTDLSYYQANTPKLIEFFKTYANNKGMDIAPLRALIEAHLSEKFFSSKIDYGLTSVKFPSFTPIHKRKSELNANNLGEWILASASCFPAFPVCEIEGEGYIDGGYYDNLPVNLAFELDAQQVIAIALNPEKHIYSTHPLVKTIQPPLSLGGMLDFDRASIEENITLGYLDTLKGFNKLWGRLYAFKPDRDFVLRAGYVLNLTLAMLLHNELSSKRLPFSLHRAIEIFAPPAPEQILELLREAKPKHKLGLVKSDYTSDFLESEELGLLALGLVEMMMQESGAFERERVYSFKEVAQKLFSTQETQIMPNIQNLLSTHSSQTQSYTQFLLERDLSHILFATFTHFWQQT